MRNLISRLENEWKPEHGTENDGLAFKGLFKAYIDWEVE